MQLLFLEDRRGCFGAKLSYFGREHAAVIFSKIEEAALKRSKLFSAENMQLFFFSQIEEAALKRS